MICPGGIKVCVAGPAAADVQTYLQGEASQQREKTKAAEQMLALGNTALEQGNPQQARRAFESAWNLSQHDNAFNEDARVQLHNLKLQQALVGLNVRQSSAAGEEAGIAGKLRAGRAGQEGNYTQADAKELIDRNTADDNAAFTKLAERLIQQQDAAVSNPAVIQASIPERGRLLTFSRAVAVDTWADLQIGLEAKAARAASWTVRLGILAAQAFQHVGEHGAAARLAGDHGRQLGIDHEEAGEVGLVAPREVGGHPKLGFGPLRPVEVHQDVLEHIPLPPLPTQPIHTRFCN